MITPLTIVSAAAAVALVILGLAFLLVGWRVLAGPTLPDRVLALDTLSGTAIGFIAVLAVKTGFNLYIDIAISLGLVGFLATIAFARFVISRGTVSEWDSEKRASAPKKPKVAAKRSGANERKGKG
ncbi:cation:proton antiporter [Rhizobium mesoamericanum]|uniref:PhaF2 protein n=1 Tax=Rhizobium mesoamericanum STM3625 TaxID=1211777 RepID=K0PY53_9HYPH|nr:cation:proton antiporter [Rhizobium mesoamericanum]CCM74849.1 PhaF2 protein [Rhizobium mesoamericanum STM3625]